MVSQVTKPRNCKIWENDIFLWRESKEANTSSDKSSYAASNHILDFLTCDKTSYGFWSKLLVLKPRIYASLFFYQYSAAKTKFCEFYIVYSYQSIRKAIDVTF